MKRTKRLSIEFRHRKVTITVEGSALHVPDRKPDAADPATVCPTCGSSWITMAARADRDLPPSVERIHHALHQSGLHMQVSPSGQLRICQRSFEELRESF